MIILSEALPQKLLSSHPLLHHGYGRRLSPTIAIQHGLRSHAISALATLHQPVGVGARYHSGPHVRDRDAGDIGRCRLAPLCRADLQRFGRVHGCPPPGALNGNRYCIHGRRSLRAPRLTNVARSVAIVRHGLHQCTRSISKRVCAHCCTAVLFGSLRLPGGSSPITPVSPPLSMPCSRAADVHALTLNPQARLRI